MLSVRRSSKTVARDDATTIVENGESRVEIGVVAEHRLDEFRHESDS